METHRARRGPKPKPGVRETLVEAGLQLILADGFSASGIQGIVEKANVPKGSFYTYFASKEDFGAEVIDAYASRGLSNLLKFLNNTKWTPRGRLAAYFDDRIHAFTASNFTQGCLLGNFAAEVADHSDAIRQRLARHLGALCIALEKCIAEGQKAGEISRHYNARVLANFIWNSWEGSLLRMRAEKSVAPLNEFKEIALDGILGARCSPKTS
jgi:TetR/AcrR family transcriptional repressor of nem operon